MPRRLSLCVVAVVGAVSVLAGCGATSAGSGSTATIGAAHNDSSVAPAVELRRAAAALAKSSRLTATVDVAATPTEISDLANALGTQITAAQATKLAGATLSLEEVAPAGKTLADHNPADRDKFAAAISLKNNGTTLLEMRHVAETVYLRVNVKQLLTVLGDASEFQMLSAASLAAPGFVQALLKGDWVSIPVSALPGLLSSEAAGSSIPTPSPAKAQALVTALTQALRHDVRVRRTHTGLTDRFVISASLRTIGRDISNAASTVWPDAGAIFGLAHTSHLPNVTLHGNAAVTGGALSQVSVDLGQFAGGMTRAPVAVNFAPTGAAITAPTGAVAVDTSMLKTLLGMLATR